MCPLTIDLSDPGAELGALGDALLAGRLALIPTDTVYGLVCAAHLPAACERLSELKGRDPHKPSSLLAASLESVFSTVLPELHGRASRGVRALLPGKVTVVVPNPGRRFRWLCGSTPDRIGLRVPELEPRVAAQIDRSGAVLATSANLAGDPPATHVEEVPDAMLRRCAVVVDGGLLAGGVASSVIDISGREPVLLRAGAVPDEQLFERLAEAGLVSAS